MLTLLSLISADLCNCSLLGQTTLDCEPWPPCRPWPRASQYGSSSAAVAVSLFFSPALCPQKGQGWVLPATKPAGSGRPTFSSTTSGIAPTPWLKWYSNPSALHGRIRGPPPLPVPQLLAFSVSLSFSCLSIEQRILAVRWFLTCGVGLLPAGGVVRGRCCLSCSPGAAQLLWSGCCDNCEAWAYISLVPQPIQSWVCLGFQTWPGSSWGSLLGWVFGLPLPCVGPPVVHHWELKHCGPRWGWPPTVSALVIVTTMTSNV